MIKLYNLSGLPDEPLKTLLQDAMRLAGAKGTVVVKVCPGGRIGNCYAKSCSHVARWFLAGRGGRKSNGKHRDGWIKTGGGYVVIRPWYAYGSEMLQGVEWLFGTMIHEFVHILDYQRGGKSALAWSTRNAAGRRPKHDSRPEEIRANNGRDAALQRLEKQPERYARIRENIINLAIQMDAKRGVK